MPKRHPSLAKARHTRWILQFRILECPQSYKIETETSKKEQTISYPLDRIRLLPAPRHFDSALAAMLVEACSVTGESWGLLRFSRKLVVWPESIPVNLSMLG